MDLYMGAWDGRGTGSPGPMRQATELLVKNGVSTQTKSIENGINLINKSITTPYAALCFISSSLTDCVLWLSVAVGLCDQLVHSHACVLPVSRGDPKREVSAQHPRGGTERWGLCLLRSIDSTMRILPFTPVLGSICDINVDRIRHAR